MKRILIVEDDPDLSDIVQRILQQKGGYAVSTATNGLHALEQAMIERPDLILCDVMMPVMDGKEFVEHLRFNPEYATIPVLLMTAHSIKPSEAEQYRAVLQKPFAFDELLTTVSRCLAD